jgi:hypothetical protein
MFPKSICIESALGLFQPQKRLIIHSAFLLALFACHPTIFAQQARAGKPDSRELHGGIEVAQKAVRVIALRISHEDEGYNVKILYSDSVTPSRSYPQDGKLSPDYTREVAQIIQRLSEKLQKDYLIPPGQIYLVGLSDLTPQNPDDLVKDIRNLTGKTINFLNEEAEVQLSIAGIIPRRYISNQTPYDNRGISTLIEIGHTTTKGGYQQLRRLSSGKLDYDYVTWSIPKGAITFFREIDKAAGEAIDYRGFAERAEILSNSSFKNLIKIEAARKPGIMNRKKIYLIGEIVWAMITLLHPEDQRPYVPVTIGDINTFYNRAITDPESLLNPDLSKISDDQLRNEIRKNREAVKQTFSPKALIAGAELLKSLSVELNFKEKTLIYPRFSPLARILSYVRLQPE